MNIFLKDNDLKILRYIIYNNNCTIKKISESINLSDVYIRKSIKKINIFLELKYNIKIIKTGKYFYFPSEKKILSFENFCEDSSTLYTASKKLRIDYILINLIFEKQIKLTAVAKFFNVTRLTISNDLKDIKNILKNFDLTLASKQWEGVFLNSTNDQFCFFSIEYLTKIIFEQSLALNINEQYSNITNPNLAKYFNSFIDLKTQKIMIIFLKKIIKYFNLYTDIFSFQSFYAALIFSYINKEYHFSNIFFEKRKYLKLDIDKYSNILRNINNYNLIKDLNLDFLSILIIGNTASALDTSKFFHPCIFDIILKLKSFFKVDFLIEDELIIKNMLKTYLFKKKFDLLYFSIPTKNISNDDLNFISKLNLMINKEQAIIYYNDIVTFSFFLKALKKKYVYKEIQNSNILLVDSSYNLWISENLKNFITLNYGVSKINLINIFQNIKWESTISKYDIIFFINLKKPDIIASFSNCYEISYFGNNQFFLEDYINFGGSI
ncbi:MAG: helix-turn-helix domain-containing protein [Cetobacterium sp.]